MATNNGLWGAERFRGEVLNRAFECAKYPIRDNDSKFGPCFARVAMTGGIEILKRLVHTPRANAICERFMSSVRQACLDHLLIFQEKQHEPHAEARKSPTRKQARPVLATCSIRRSDEAFENT